MGIRNSKPEREEDEEAPTWSELPDDIMANILHRLGAVRVLGTVQKVCTNWRRACKDPSTWRVIDMRNVNDLLFLSCNRQVMCRQAVDHSQGQLIDINIEYFGTDDLLLYIAQRCNHPKRLTLALCDHISSQGLIKAVERFPELEELHLHFMKNISDEDIENIGTSCPLLKSFTYNNRGSIAYSLLPEAARNASALGIAKSMPNLRRLGFCGAKMNHEGLEAILNSCPHLESLDIRHCYGAVPMGDLGNRCFQQMKYLRGPHDIRIDDDGCDSSFNLDFYLNGDYYERWDGGYHDNLDDYCDTDD